ncbi:MAG: pyrimidine-nucleoside phosphorylase [Anaerolineae bacterium]
MNIVEIIEKKRDGQALTTEEIQFFVQGYTDGLIPDYQAAALLMAIVLQGMDDRETGDLTLAMAHSGDILDLSDTAPFVVDKHSTGGVGDKVTLVVAPIVASQGLPVGKMSGRGLGFSGGTLDKLESVPGFTSDLSPEAFKRQLREIGIVVAGQSANLAPADGKMYALRDVTGTVQSLPLIVGSVMSKKIAGGADAIVLDVKCGSGAFMKTLDDARTLAKAMVRIGKRVGRKVTALISDMNQPLGSAVGNALELREAIDVLHNGGPEDVREHCLVVAGEMLYLGNLAESPEAGKQRAAEALASGAAWEKFRQLIEAQGGDLTYVDEPERLPQAQFVETVKAEKEGYLAKVQTDAIGFALVNLGAGREKKGQPIDHAVGLLMHVKVGDHVAPGDPLFTLHTNDEARQQAVKRRILKTLTFSDETVKPLPLFYARIT